MIFKSTAGSAYSFDPATGVIHHSAIEFPPDHPTFVCNLQFYVDERETGQADWLADTEIM